jgi:hypothetical protein
VARPFGRAARLPADAEVAWHVGRGPAAKSPLWRLGCWLVGLTAVAVGLRLVLWPMGGAAPFALVTSSWLLTFVVAGVLMTLPYGISRVRGAEEYTPPRDAFVIVPQKLSTVLFVMVFWRSLLSVGDALMTLAWNAAGRRWLEAHPPPGPPDPLEEEIQAAVDNDPGWWARDP